MSMTRHKDRNVTKGFDRANTSRCLPAMKITAAALIVVSAIGGPVLSHAQVTLGAESVLDELEKAFWVCDYAATTSLVDFYSAIACSYLTESLRQRKFDGDFQAMLTWWQQHKEAKHLELSKGGSTSVPRLAPRTSP